MTDDKPIRVLAISGSLRKKALNTALHGAAQELVSDGMSIEICEGRATIPPYDDDVRLAGFPRSIEALRDRVRNADALIFATPDYNRFFSGVLKNVID